MSTPCVGAAPRARLVSEIRWFSATIGRKTGPLGTKFIATKVLERIEILSEWFRIGFARFRAVSHFFLTVVTIRSYLAQVEISTHVQELKGNVAPGAQGCSLSKGCLWAMLFGAQKSLSVTQDSPSALCPE